MLTVIGTLALPPGESWWHILAAPEEDGHWRVITIDGADVRPSGYSLHVRWGRITGFHDGCNGCGFQDDRQAGSRDRRMICTLVACPRQPRDPVFFRIVGGAPAMAPNGDHLVMTVGPHRAELVRVLKSR